MPVWQTIVSNVKISWLIRWYHLKSTVQITPTHTFAIYTVLSLSTSVEFSQEWLPFINWHFFRNTKFPKSITFCVFSVTWRRYWHCVRRRKSSGLDSDPTRIDSGLYNFCFFFSFSDLIWFIFYLISVDLDFVLLLNFWSLLIVWMGFCLVHCWFSVWLTRKFEASKTAWCFCVILFGFEMFYHCSWIKRKKLEKFKDEEIFCY